MPTYPSESSTIEGPSGNEDGSSILQDSSDALAPPPLPDARVQPADGMLHVSLPSEAKLFVNGKQTRSTGETRKFVSSGLKEGFRYPYAVKAVLERDGQTMEQSKNVNLRAGESARLSFDFDEKVDTKLTIHVPADAELVLAGSPTKSKGAERNFSTKRLATGQIWEDYTIEVTVNRDGRELTKSQTIDLRGGEAKTLTFDFDQDQVAAR